VVAGGHEDLARGVQQLGAPLGTTEALARRWSSVF